MIGLYTLIGVLCAALLYWTCDLIAGGYTRARSELRWHDFKQSNGQRPHRRP